MPPMKTAVQENEAVQEATRRPDAERSNGRQRRHKPAEATKRNGGTPTLKINKTWAKMLKPLWPTEYELLKRSIKARGILAPIIVDEKRQIIDGMHRAKIAQELGIADVPLEVKEGLTEDQKLEQVILLNAARRHMPGDDITVAAKALKTEGWSNRRIAALLGVSEPTARLRARARP